MPTVPELTDDQVFGTPTTTAAASPASTVRELTDDDVFGEADDRLRSRVRQSAVAGSGQTPDSVLQAEAMGSRYGLPPVVAGRNMDELRRRAEADDMAGLVDSSPKLAEWFADDAGAAVVAKPDVGGLSALETLLTFTNPGLAMAAGTDALFGTEVHRPMLDTVGAVLQGVGQPLGTAVSGAGSLLDAGARHLDRQVRWVAGDDIADLFWFDGPRYANPANILNDVGEGIESATAGAAPPEERQTLATDIASGLGQVGSYAAVTALTGGVGGLALGAGQGADIQADRARAAGTYGEAGADAALVGGAAITAVTERLGLKWLFRRLPEGVQRSLQRKVTDILMAGGGEAAQEITEGIAQDALTKALVDSEYEMFQGLDREALAAGGVGLIVRSMLHLGRARVDAEQAKREREQIAEVGKIVDGLSLREADPGRLRAVLARLKGAGWSDVWVPMPAWQTLFQSPQEADVARQAAGVNDADYAAALLSGGSLRVPTEGFYAGLTPEQRKPLYEVARRTAGGMTPADADGYDPEVALGEMMAEFGIEGRPADDPSNRAYEQIRMELERAGASPDVAAAQAEQFAAFLRTQMARTGLAIDGTRASVVAAMDPKLQAVLRGRNADPVLDGLIAAVRSGRQFSEREVHGTRLVSELVRAGGINPNSFGAGDLRHMDARYRPGLLNLGGMSLEDALVWARETGFIDRPLSNEGDVYDANAPDLSTLLEMISGDLAGVAPAFARDDINVDRQAFNHGVDALRQELESKGITDERLAEMSDAEVREALGFGRQFDEDGEVYEQVSPATARKLKGETKLPTDTVFTEAVANTPGAEITPDGLEMDLVRFQKPEQVGDTSVRTGVFYLPAGSKNARYYRTKPGQSAGNHYGGQVQVRGRALMRRPLFVKGATGGKAPEAAYDAIKGKGAMKALDSEVMGVVTEKGWMNRQESGLFEHRVAEFLERHGADGSIAYELIHNSSKGNQLRYALQENIIAHAVRAAGYDSVVGYSKGKAGPSISEVFDVREVTYPTEGGESDIHETFFQSHQPATDQTQTPEFKAWFGESKVVDADGKPLVVYHGADKKRTEFKKGFGDDRGENLFPQAFFFSPDKDLAETYGEEVTDAFLRLENPYIARTKEELDRLEVDDAEAELRAEGYDGAILYLHIDGPPEYVVFEPSQIKSATGNRGTFDPNDASILHQSQQDNDLVATHNLSAENLLHALRIGGLPVPSLAVSKGDQSLSGFGEITLIGSKSLVDPRLGAKAFGADIYSPRYPQITFKLDKHSLGLLNKILADHRDGREIYGGEITSLRDLSSNDAFRAYAEAQGISTADGGAMDSLAAKVMRDIGADERIFQGFTPSGNRRYTPHTLANVIKILKKELRGGEGINYGAGSLRAKFTPQFRSIAAIKKAKGRLAKKEAFDAAKADVEKELFAIADDLAPYYNYDANRFGFSDTVINMIGDAARGGLDRQLREYGFTDVPAETKNRIYDYMAALREMPTEYFEVKQLRAVDIGEFSAAAVPVGTSDEVLSALRDRGINVIEYERGNDESRRAAVNKIAADDGLLFQRDGQSDPRGSLTIHPSRYPGGLRQFTITLGETRDFSTFLHESAHFYLEIMREIDATLRAADPATLTDSQKRVLADHDALLKQLGVDSFDAITREQHEQFAETYEAYLREGKAPSPRLARAFHKFGAWLKLIYRTLLKLPNQKLNDETRAIFDRMLATDDEIDAARAAQSMGPLFATPEAAGMTPEEFASYQEALRVARESAVQGEAAEQYRYELAERRRWKSEEMAHIRAQVTPVVDAAPGMKAKYLLRNGTQPDGSPLPDGQKPLKLNTAAVTDRYGKAWVQKNLAFMTAKDGVHPDLVASVLGFQNGDALVTAVANTPNRQDAIRAATEEAWRARHPDPMTDGATVDRVQQRVHNDAQAEVMVREINALNSRAGRAPGKPTVLTVMKQAAERIIAGQRVGSINANQYRVAEAKAGRDALKAAAEGRWDDAVKARRQQLMSGLLFRAAVDARERAEAVRAQMVRLAKKPAQEKFARAGWESYLERVNDILHAYDVRRLSLKELQRRASMRGWVERQQEAGDVTAVTEGLIERVEAQTATNWRDATVAELDAAGEALSNIEHLARLKNKLVAAAREAEKDEAVNEMVERAAESLPTEIARPVSGADLTTGQQVGRKLAGIRDEFTRPENFIEALDGGESGPWHDFIWSAMNRAEETMIALRKRLGSALKALRTEMPPDVMQGLGQTVTVFGIPTTRASLIGAVLNTGNAGNLQRLRDGGIAFNDQRLRLTDAQIQQMRGLLTAAELRYVQGLWTTVNSLWGDIVALQRRMSGLPPAKVEALPFTVTSADGVVLELEGGYWPLAYDKTRSTVGDKQAAGDAMQLMMGQGFTRAATPKGYQKTRVDTLEAPLQLDFGAVMSRHLDQVMTDLAYREAVRDVTMLLGDQRVKDAIISRLGEPALESLNGMLSYSVSASSEIGRAAGRMQSLADGVLANMTVSTLAIRPDIALGNYVSAMVQGLDRAGLRGLLRGLWRAYTPGRERMTAEITRLSPFMAERLEDTDYYYRHELGRTRRERGLGAAYKRVVMTLHRAADHEVTRALWWGRFQNEIDRGATQAEAVRLADKTVRQTQTASGRKDLSTFERDPAFRQSRQFMGPMFVIFGRMNAAARGQGATRSAGTRLASTLTQVFIAPAVFALMAGRWPEDDLDDDDEIGPFEWGMWLAVNTLLFPLQTIPFVRDAGSAIEAAVTGNPINARAAPLSAAATNMVKAGDSIWENIADYRDGEDLDYFDLTRDLATLFAPLTAAPASQVRETTRAIEYFKDNPDAGATEMAEMAVYGAPPN